MTLQERFLRWYTGRLIPQAPDQPGWYPEDVPRRFPIASQAEIDAAYRKAMTWHRSTTDQLRGLEQAILRLQGIPPLQYSRVPDRVMLPPAMVDDLLERLRHGEQVPFGISEHPLR